MYRTLGTYGLNSRLPRIFELWNRLSFPQLATNKTGSFEYKGKKLILPSALVLKSSTLKERGDKAVHKKPSVEKEEGIWCQQHYRPSEGFGKQHAADIIYRGKSPLVCLAGIGRIQIGLKSIYLFLLVNRTPMFLWIIEIDAFSMKTPKQDRPYEFGRAELYLTK